MLRSAVLNVQNVSTARGKGCAEGNTGHSMMDNLQAEGCSELAEMADKALEETAMRPEMSIKILAAPRIKSNRPNVT